MNTARAARLLTAGLAALLLAGCASFSTPPQTFDLEAPGGAPAGSAATRTQLLIAEPTAVRTLDSQQIAIQPSTLTVEYLADAQWTDRLPRLVQLRLLQAFQNTGRAGAVGVPGQGLAIDFQIVTEIRRFEIALEESAAIVEISVKALNDRSGVVRASQIFQARVPLQGAGNPAYVVALNQAFSQVTDEIVAWTLRTL
jgi:cholesterol transport system auxiliary component